MFGKEKQNMKRSMLETAIGADTLRQIEELVANEKKIPPKVAVIGKAGVGKTTTINNLFNVKWRTSHTIVGTTEAETEIFELEGGGALSVTDMPGLGEDIDADAEYEQIYSEILPNTDIVLWVMQANAKDMADDQRILRDTVLPAIGDLKGRLIIGLNQVDKIGPELWDLKLNCPSKEQAKSIVRRCNDITEKLSKVVKIDNERIVYYSALQRFRLYDLLVAIIKAADDKGWKFPINPADPFELADPEVQKFVKQVRETRKESGDK